MRWLLLFLVLPCLISATFLKDVTALACKRNHSLSICKSISLAHDLRPPKSQPVLLSSEDLNHLKEISQAVARIKRNPFSNLEDFEEGHGGKDLREKETTDGAPLDDDDLTETTPATVQRREGFLLQSEKEHVNVHDAAAVHATFEGKTSEYCNKFEEHFSFYCVGDVDSNGENSKAVAIFCPAYKSACPDNTKGSLTSWPSTPLESSPSDPFNKPVQVETKHRRILVEDDSSDSDEEDVVDKHEKQKTVYLAELKRRFPCKQDCDQRLFPHCTAECKCDWIYPTVQRFCNPPPMPFFLNTCRLWYWSCPKYERYHYASQFMYSKAEKGKVLPGQVSNPNPYGIPSQMKQMAGSPSGAHTLDHPIPLSPIARSAKTLFVIPPELPDEFRKRDVEEVTSAEKMSPSEARNVLRRAFSRRYQERNQSVTSAWVPSERAEPSRTNVQAINDLTKNPAALSQDPASLISPQLDGARPRAHQAGTIPVVPSDAAYGAQDPFRAFDGLTDSRGILHRPRSTSPFTKPGLWIANPDDPHNRDHANKWWYHPESVGVDWLNGQLQWGAHWAVPAAGTGGTDGQSTLHFPSIGNFLNIADDYD